MLSTLFRLRPHNIRAHPFGAYQLQLSSPKSASSQRTLISRVPPHRVRHVSNLVITHESVDYDTPSDPDTTSLVTDTSSSYQHGESSSFLSLDPASHPNESETTPKERRRQGKDSQQCRSMKDPLQTKNEEAKLKRRATKSTATDGEDEPGPAKREVLKERKTSNESQTPKEHETAKEPKLPGKPKPWKEAKIKVPKAPRPPREPKPPKEPKARKVAALPPNQIESYLDVINTQGDAFTKAEIELYKPETRPDETSPRYPRAYGKLMATLLRSFRVEQLADIIDLYELKIPPGFSRTKNDYAALLVEEAWGWTSVARIQEKKRDQELADTSLELEPHELSLLLGQDGTHLQKIATQYDVNIHPQQNGTSLRLNGRLGQTKRFMGYLERFRQDIITQELSLPFGSAINTVSDKTLESISRISGAFIERKDEKISASFLKNNRHSAEKVKYLIVQALAEERISAVPGAILAGTSSQYTNHDAPINYSLFPFAAHRTPSWKDSSRGAFRLRKIGHWLDTIHDQAGVGLLDVARETSSIVIGGGRSTTLLDTLTAPFYQQDPSEIRIRASCGHLLFSAPPSRRLSIRPPLEGQLTINNILGHSTAVSTYQKVFYPCVPSNLDTQAFRKQEETIKKLIYIAHNFNTDAEGLNRTMVFEVVEQEGEEGSSLWSCCLENELVLDLSMPDRPLDIRISSSTCERLDASEWAAQFNVPIKASSEKHPIPSTLTIRDEQYMLLSNTDIQRRRHQTGAHPSEYINLQKVHDNHSGLTAFTAEITCEGHQIKADWNAFLRRCDSLTSVE